MTNSQIYTKCIHRFASIIQVGQYRTFKYIFALINLIQYHIFTCVLCFFVIIYIPHGLNLFEKMLSWQTLLLHETYEFLQSPQIL